MPCFDVSVRLLLVNTCAHLCTTGAVAGQRPGSLHLGRGQGVTFSQMPLVKWYLGDFRMSAEEKAEASSLLPSTPSLPVPTYTSPLGTLGLGKNRPGLAPICYL
jgi:hypothetical protein